MKAYNASKGSCKERRRAKKGALRVSFTYHEKNSKDNMFTEFFGEHHSSVKRKGREITSRILIK
ncbi:MAG: hypothetical protein ACRCU6_11030 [Fusobacteriaceae bacterium]